MMTADLILEIGTEEIPAGMIPSLLRDLTSLAEEKFTEARIDFADFNSYSTPRRLVLQGKDIAEKQADKEESIRGPATDIAFDEEGNPTKAGTGFARGQGVDLEEITIRDGYLFFEKTITGQPTEEVLENLLPEIINDLPQPQKMRWGDKDYRFVRPIRWICALLDEKAVEFELAGLSSGRTTRGHRFLGEEAVEIKQAEDYFTTLKKEKVIVKNEERQKMILEQIDEILAPNQETEASEELLTEVVNLVEYPTAFLGEFAEEFLDLPAEVLTTSMIKHQRYFPVVENNELTNKFIGVRNGTAEHLAEVIKGNEKVIRARLADAVFFYQEDQQRSLSDFNDKLKNIVYQQELGTLADKVKRLQSLAEKIGSLIADQEIQQQAERAAELAKFDLATEMVREFASLQGVMGAEYARLAGEDEAVAQAIAEQYLPAGSEDALPESKAGIILSLVDKIDDIISNFLVGNIPSGSQDPFALRRKATAIIRLIIEKGLNLNLKQLIKLGQEEIEAEGEVLEKVLEFMKQRLRNYLADKGIRYDVVNAVLSVKGHLLVDIYERCQAVMKLREKDHEDFLALMYGLQRCQNLALQGKSAENIQGDIFAAEEEQELWNNYQEVIDEVNNYYQSNDYFSALLSIADLKDSIDTFLDNVVVMVDDPALRQNRLALLEQIAKLIEPVMDINKIALDED